MNKEALKKEWTTLYRTTLPGLAKKRSPAQPKWPVYLDHCFARIILDNAVGEDQPWTKVLKSPAVNNMDEKQLKAAIEMGNNIAKGKADIVTLDNRSLKLRGKKQKGVEPKNSKSKANTESEVKTTEQKSTKQRRAKKSEVRKRTRTAEQTKS